MSRKERFICPRASNFFLNFFENKYLAKPWKNNSNVQRLGVGG